MMPRVGHGFVAANVVLLIAFSVVPTVYAIHFAFTNAGNRFTGLSNFTSAAADFRFVPPPNTWRFTSAARRSCVTRVALPLAAPIVTLVGFFSFVANWANYFLPYVMLPQSSQFPVQVGLGTLLDNVPQFNPTVGTLAVQRPELALATLLAIIPVLVLFSSPSASWSPDCWPARLRAERPLTPTCQPPPCEALPAERGCGPA
jgi:hypothetical protein